MPLTNGRTAMTPPQLARRLGVAADKILTWIRRGDLRAVNVALRRTRKGQRILYFGQWVLDWLTADASREAAHAD